MEKVALRAGLAVALVCAASSASAQLAPARSIPAARSSLERAAASGATLLRADDGRIRTGWGLSIVTRGATPEARARAFVSRYAGELALASGVELAVHRHLESHGFDIVRMTRIAHGGPVLGSSVVVRMVGDVVDYVAVSHVAAPIGAGSPQDLEVARELALREVGALRVTDAFRGGIEIEGAVVPYALVDVRGQHMHQRWRVAIVADRVVFARSLVLDALGRVYAEDPVSDSMMTTDVELLGLTSRDFLTGRFFRVFNCNAGSRGCEPIQTARADMAGDFLYDPEEPSFDDPFAEVHGYFHANRVAEYFRDTHGFTWTCGTETLMRVFVNYTEEPGVPYDNAAYSPGGGRDCGLMLFGQGRTRDFVYDADVVYHEFGHGVVDLTAGLGFFLIDGMGVAYDPGSINEGVADYFAATVAGDPAMAEYFTGSGLSGESALRNLDNDFVCPDDLVGEVHFDGRIFAGFLWDVREAIGVEKADELVFISLGTMGEVVSLSEATETVLATAGAMETAGTLTSDERAMVQGAADARGLLGCERAAPLDGGVTRLAFSGTSQITGNVGGGLAPVHYRIEIPPDAERLSFMVNDITIRDGEYTIYWRTGGPVRFVASRRPPVIAEGSLAPGDALTRMSDPPLPRCETLYLTVRTDNLASVEQTLYEVSAQLSRSGIDESCEEPDAGVPTVDAGTMAEDAGSTGSPGGGGCGCRVAASGVRGFALLFGAALIWVSRRRRASA